MKIKLLFLSILLASLPLKSYGEIPTFRLNDEIKEILSQDETPTIEGKPLRSAPLLKAIYQDRGWKPLWIQDKGLNAKANEFFYEVIENALGDGLNPETYHLSFLKKIFEGKKKKLKAEDKALHVELLLSDAFVQYASHLKLGRFNHDTLRPRLLPSPSNTEFLQKLISAIGNKKPSEAIDDFRPQIPEYVALSQAMKKLIARSAKWVPITKGAKLSLGDKSKRVVEVRKRLVNEGLLNPKDKAEWELYDASMDRAIRHFQANHGLEVDGSVGPTTLAFLNAPPSQEICQVAVNLDRLRTAPTYEKEPRYVKVNVPGYQLEAGKYGQPSLTMKVIVGRKDRPTPIFDDEMVYLVFNPTWNVPNTIAIKDKLPLLQKNPDYLAANSMHLYKMEEGKKVEIDPSTIDWNDVTPKTFNYRISQAPGDGNALGKIKFIFPNEYDVYMHDTSERHLFKRHARSFSSGCVRVEKPLALAEFALQDQEDWDLSTIQELLDSNKEKVVKLTQNIPVHLIYRTAWVDSDDELQLREDIYKRDVAAKAFLCPSLPQKEPKKKTMKYRNE